MTRKCYLSLILFNLKYFNDLLNTILIGRKTLLNSFRIFI